MSKSPFSALTNEQLLKKIKIMKIVMLIAFVITITLILLGLGGFFTYREINTTLLILACWPAGVIIGALIVNKKIKNEMDSRA